MGSEGICIASSRTTSEYSLLIRTDRKREGLRVFCDVVDNEHAVSGEMVNADRGQCPRGSNSFEFGQTIKAMDRLGLIRYIGTTQFAPGSWIGVEFDEPVGQCDGSFGGETYFRCKPFHGVFLRPEEVSLPQST